MKRVLPAERSDRARRYTVAKGARGFAERLAGQVLPDQEAAVGRDGVYALLRIHGMEPTSRAGPGTAAWLYRGRAVAVLLCFRAHLVANSRVFPQSFWGSTPDFPAEIGIPTESFCSAWKFLGFS